MFPTPEEHTFWHMQNGPRELLTCPWDCYDPPEHDEFEWEAGNVTCGHCGQRKRSVEHVRLCPER